MTSPVVYNLMSGGKAMVRKQADAPELAKNVNLLMWYPYGAYHFAVRADSDIQTLMISKAPVFLGPKGRRIQRGQRLGCINNWTGCRRRL